MSKYHVTFTPSVCEGPEAAHEGTITLRSPTYDERLELYAGTGLSFDGASADDFASRVASMRYVAKRAADFVVAVDIKRKADGYKFTWDDVLHDTDVGPCVTEVVHRLLSGKYAAGNAPEPS